MASEPDTCDLLCLDLPKAEALRAELPPAHELEAPARAARALGDATRLAIAIALRDGERACVCDLAWVVGRDEKLVSHHVRQLKAAGLARSQPDGRMVMYELTDARPRAARRRHGRGARMNAVELPVVRVAPARDDGWLRAAHRARLLSWASLVWMTIEGVVGLAAGFEANSLSLLIWAASSFVEGLASVTIIWRFTGSRMHSATSERTAQRWVAGSFLLLVPYFVYESLDRALNGSDVHANAAGIAVTASAIVLMPALGWAKLRLARRLGSEATAGEGVQNLLCAAQAAAALVALIGAGAGLEILDPIAALVISAIAIRECVGLWRGEDDCCAPVGFADPAADGCHDDCCT